MAPALRANPRCSSAGVPLSSSTDEIGRGHLLPGRRADGLSRDVQALPREPVSSLGLGVGVAVLEERLREGRRANTERAAHRVDVEKRGGGAVTEVGQDLSDVGQVAGHQQQVAHGADPGGCLGGDDPPVAVGDDYGRFIAVLQDLPDCRDVLGQPRTTGAGR